MTRRSIARTKIHDLEINYDYYQRHQQFNPTTGCIEWNAGRHRQGYGMCGAWRVKDGHRIMTTTHRIAARLHYDRPLHSDEFVIHTCSNMACMTPQHLIIGNYHDMQNIMRQNARHRPWGNAPKTVK